MRHQRKCLVFFETMLMIKIYGSEDKIIADNLHIFKENLIIKFKYLNHFTVQLKLDSKLQIKSIFGKM